MAVILSIDITTAEQTKIIEWIDLLFPNNTMTALEKKTALETHAKKLLRDDLLNRVSIFRLEEARQLAYADQSVIDTTNIFASPDVPAP